MVAAVAVAESRLFAPAPLPSVGLGPRSLSLLRRLLQLRQDEDAVPAPPLGRRLAPVQGVGHPPPGQLFKASHLDILILHTISIMYQTI